MPLSIKMQGQGQDTVVVAASMDDDGYDVAITAITHAALTRAGMRRINVIIHWNGCWNGWNACWNACWNG
jgi:hypothetical protein